jgi:ESS family glutamate:Na+ symporter
METGVVNGLLTLKFNMIQTVALGVIMYYFGVFFRNKVHLFVKLSIPASAIGGLSTAFLVAFLRYKNIIGVHFDLTLQSMLMVMFFCTVGMNASYKLLMNGGLLIIAFWVICAGLAILQNIVGVLFAKVMGINPLLGIISGSVSMMGGLGTAGTFGNFFENVFGINGAVEAGVACATLGMIVGSALGGPLAEWVIRKHKLTTPHAELIGQSESSTGDQSSDYEEVGAFAQEEGMLPDPLEEKEDFINGPHLMKNLSLVLVAMGLGSAISYYFNKTGLLLPSYLITMLVAVFFRNLGDFSKLIKIDTKAIGMISDVSLAIFVTMAIMSLNLSHLVELAFPLLIIMLIQVILVLIIAYFGVFLLLGKNYEAVVMSAGLVGFGLGATPNALANMQTLMLKHGETTKAFFVVSIVGAFLIDFTNAILIMFFVGIVK